MVITDTGLKIDRNEHGIIKKRLGFSSGVERINMDEEGLGR